eukprot:9702229-Alexandrium_andersonii.AAC.1
MPNLADHACARQQSMQEQVKCLRTKGHRQERRRRCRLIANRERCFELGRKKFHCRQCYWRALAAIHAHGDTLGTQGALLDNDWSHNPSESVADMPHLLCLGTEGACDQA